MRERLLMIALWLSLAASHSSLVSPRIPAIRLPNIHRCPPVVCVLGVPADDGDEDDDEADEQFLDELEFTLRQDRSGRRPNRVRPNRERFGAPLAGVRTLFGELKESYDDYASKPSQQLLLGSLALLFGFFVSHGQLLGGGDQGGRWEYASGLVATLVVERITKGYYKIKPDDRSPTLQLLNAFKVGFFYGCVLDALKFGG
jgi:hypothetical protein